MASANVSTYKIKIGKEKYEVESSDITGSGILALTGKPHERSIIYQKLKGGGRAVVALDEIVDLTEPGREKFVIIPCDQTEGYVGRVDFSLPAADVEFLNTLGCRWETVLEGNIRRIVIYDYPVPNGYTTDVNNINLRIGMNYPDEQIDMAYFYPAIQRPDGIAIPAIAEDSFNGKKWQRWSRHRTPQNPWLPGEDDISTHLVCVNQWLIKELEK